jgi:hypothetical protein
MKKEIKKSYENILSNEFNRDYSLKVSKFSSDKKKKQRYKIEEGEIIDWKLYLLNKFYPKNSKGWKNTLFDFIRNEHEYKVQNYETIDSGNLYSYVIERSFAIMKNYNYVGMIIPISAFCTARMKSLMKLFLGRTKCSYISNYAERPSKLFEGAEGSGWILKQKGNKKFKIEPYGEEYSFLELPKGKTTIFIDGICGNDILSQFDLSTQGETASISSKGEVTQKNLYEVYEDEIMKCMKKILINKGSGNSLSKKNNEKIINFI